RAATAAFRWLRCSGPRRRDHRKRVRDRGRDLRRLGVRVGGEEGRRGGRGGATAPGDPAQDALGSLETRPFPPMRNGGSDRKMEGRGRTRTGSREAAQNGLAKAHVGSNPTARTLMRPAIERLQVRDLADAGHDPAQIARLTGIPYTTVRKWLKSRYADPR